MNYLFDTVKGEKAGNLLTIAKMSVAAHISVLFDDNQEGEEYIHKDTEYEFKLKIYSVKKNLGLDIGNFTLYIESGAVNDENYYEYRWLLNLEDLIIEPGIGDYTVSLYARKQGEDKWEKQTSHRLIVE